MQAVIEIPTPTARDSETVATALETAAVFRAKGDAAEALRWLQRAAESAGDDGDDERTLALARTAADLSHALQHPAVAPPAQVSSDQHTPPHSRRLPKPPPRAGSARLPYEEGAESEPPPARARPSHTPSPPSQAPLSYRPPVAPSSRPAAPAHTAPAHTARAYAARGPSAPASSRALPSSPSRPAQPRVSSPPLSAVPTQIEMRESDSSAQAEADAEADADTQRVTQPVPAPSSGHFAEGGATAKLRQAARVSVVASPVEPGLFLVRLLDDGAAPPVDAAEALMVLVDPNSTVFSD